MFCSRCVDSPLSLTCFAVLVVLIKFGLAIPASFASGAIGEFTTILESGVELHQRNAMTDSGKSDLIP